MAKAKIRLGRSMSNAQCTEYERAIRCLIGKRATTGAPGITSYGELSKFLYGTADYTKAVGLALAVNYNRIRNWYLVIGEYGEILIDDAAMRGTQVQLLQKDGIEVIAGRFVDISVPIRVPVTV